jgi:hypothetical protein
MGKCGECGYEMNEGHPCTYIYMKDSKGMSRRGMAEEFPCHDCGATLKKGEGCHHWGCDMERCPRCGNQLLMCECWEDSVTLILPKTAEPVGYNRKTGPFRTRVK